MVVRRGEKKLCEMTGMETLRAVAEGMHFKSIIHGGRSKAKAGNKATSKRVQGKRQQLNMVSTPRASS